MDRSYEVEAAAQRLETLAFGRYNSSHSGIQLSRVTSPSVHYEPVSVGRSWNFVHKNTSEEVVVSFQGIIVKKDLPPFTERLGRNSNHVRFLRQSVSIGGFETPTFARVVNATAEIHAVLGRAVGLHNVLDCGMISSVNDIQIVELSNRYLKPRQTSDGSDEVALTSDVDPYGYLANAASAMGLYHSEDNIVQYFEREGFEEENYKYRSIKPLIFGVGDIVEVQASFVLFPLRDGKYKSGMVLRGLTLLDGSFTQAQTAKKLIVHKTLAQPKKVLKRKVGYGEEELSVTRAKLARMDIDGNSVLAGSELSAETALEEDLVEGALGVVDPSLD